MPVIHINQISTILIVLWAVLGAFIGFIVNRTDSRSVRGGVLGSIVFGLIGGLLGVYLAYILFYIPIYRYDSLQLLAAIVGGFILAFVYQTLFREHGNIKTTRVQLR